MGREGKGKECGTQGKLICVHIMNALLICELLSFYDDDDICPHHLMYPQVDNLGKILTKILA